jgi:hypothetical protein
MKLKDCCVQSRAETRPGLLTLVLFVSVLTVVVLRPTHAPPPAPTLSQADQDAAVLHEMRIVEGALSVLPLLAMGGGVLLIGLAVGAVLGWWFFLSPMLPLLALAGWFGCLFVGTVALDFRRVALQVQVEAIRARTAPSPMPLAPPGE